MRWRTFTTLLSGAALVWCTHSYAQPPDKVHRAAVISPTPTAIENWRREMIPELAGSALPRAATSSSRIT